MRFPGHRIGCTVLSILLAFLPAAALPQPSRDKVIWNYEGGIFFATDGATPDGPCFRISGRVNAPNFFDDLKRVDNEAGTTFRRGKEVITNFPDMLLLTFVLHDLPCSTKLVQTEPPTYLTREQVAGLQLSIFWKRGIAMRPAEGIQKIRFAVSPVKPFATKLANELPEKLEWVYELAVPSEDVPLTDSLVLVVRTSSGHIAARVAARM